MPFKEVVKVTDLSVCKALFEENQETKKNRPFKIIR